MATQRRARRAPDKPLVWAGFVLSVRQDSAGPQGQIPAPRVRPGSTQLFHPRPDPNAALPSFPEGSTRAPRQTEQIHSRGSGKRGGSCLLGPCDTRLGTIMAHNTVTKNLQRTRDFYGKKGEKDSARTLRGDLDHPPGKGCLRNREKNKGGGGLPQCGEVCSPGRTNSFYT